MSEFFAAYDSKNSGVPTNNFNEERFGADVNAKKQELFPTERVMLIKLRKDELDYSCETSQDSGGQPSLSMKAPNVAENIQCETIIEDKNYEYDPVEKLNGTYKFNENFVGENTTDVKVENVPSSDEVVEAICNIPTSPLPMKQELEPIPCLDLHNETLPTENPNFDCSLPTEEQIFVSPIYPPPQTRGRRRIASFNIPSRPGTPYPHIISRKDFNHFTHTSMPTINSPHAFQLHHTPPHAANIVFNASGDSGPFISSVPSSSSSSFTSSSVPSSSSSSFASSSNETHECSTPSISEFFSTPPFNVSSFDVSTDSEGIVQNVIGADGQTLAHYGDSSGLIQYFIPMVNERENHNVKERKRRSRVSSACCAMRSLIPGINDKTDKASVFEHAVEYVSFLKKNVGSKFDEVYLESLFQRT